MCWRRNIAATLMIGALGVFLFPLSAGPFSATNGPATAFRAITAAFVVLFSITTTMCFSLQPTTGRVRPPGAFSSSAGALLLQLPALRC
jgi:hypothetical protein